MQKTNKLTLANTGLATFIMAAIAIGVAANIALAQTDNDDTRGQGIELSPPIIELQADPGETVTAEIKLRNITDVEILAQGAINDFLAGDETGAPKILFEEDEESPYSLKDYIVPVPDLRIEPREVETVGITINVPEDASPGGHYGVVRFIAIPSGSDVDGSAVDLTASIGTLILLDVSGDAKESLEVEQFDTATNESLNTGNDTEFSEPTPPELGEFFEYGPVGFVTRLKNTGNVHFQPSGNIKITNMLGKEVDTIEFNATARNVLPASTRRFDHVLDSKWLFGRYTATLDLAYGGDDTDLSAVTTFWVIPWKIVAGVLLLLVTVIYFGRQALLAYKRSIIKQHRQGESNT